MASMTQDDEASAALEDLVAKACAAGRTDVVKAALEQHEFDVDAPVHVDEEEGENGHVNGDDDDDDVENDGAEPTTRRRRRRRSSALHIACEHGQVDVVRALLKLGARSDVKDDRGRTPAQVASEKVKLTLEQELLQQVAAGDVDKVRGLLDGGVDPNADDGTAAHATILHWAASFGQPRELLDILVKAGAAVHKADGNGRTPLHEACEGGHVETASALLELGARPDARDAKGLLPFQLAKTRAIRSALAALFGQLDLLEEGEQEDDGSNVGSSRPSQRKENGSAAAENPPNANASTYDPGADLASSGPTRHAVDPQDKDEVHELRRMNEEKDLTIVALRQTVESLLEQNGVLKYISKLQDEFRNVSSQLQRVSDHKEHLQSMYVKCDMELERSLQENALLRSALHEKEERLLSLLDETASVASRRHSSESLLSASGGPVSIGNGGPAVRERRSSDGQVIAEPQSASSPGGPDSENFAELGSAGEGQRRDSLRPGHSGAVLSPIRRKRSVERSESIECILMERDRLGKELEAERRLRFSEARLHLGYASDLRNQLQEAQEALSAVNGGNANKGADGSEVLASRSKPTPAPAAINKKTAQVSPAAPAVPAVSAEPPAMKKTKKTKKPDKSRRSKDEKPVKSGPAASKSASKSATNDIDEADEAFSSSDEDASDEEQGGGFLSAIYNSIFGDDETDSDSDGSGDDEEDEDDDDDEEEAEDSDAGSDEEDRHVREQNSSEVPEGEAKKKAKKEKKEKKKKEKEQKKRKKTSTK